MGSNDPNATPVTSALPAGRAEPRTARRFAEDDLVAGRYRVVRYIASGGMGDVYEVEDTEIGSRLALKTLRPGMAADERQRARFKREIQLASRVTHRNVCRIFSAGLHLEDGEPPQPFLTMELLDGESLSDRIARRGRMSMDEALPLIRQMAAALDAAHRVGVLHRDFKSGNVMLVPDESGDAERAVVTDFGLARPLDRDGDASLFMTQEAESVAGTAAFIAPEQARGGELTPAADIYAFGIVLYHMLTGQMPFSGSDALAAILARMVENPSPPRDLVPDLDPRWSAAVLRCLERDPKDRFARALDVVEAFEGRRPVLSARQRRRRARIAAAVAAAAAVVATLGITSPWWLGRGDELDPSDPVQITSDEGLEIDPAYSPDGATLVYSSDRDGSFELYQRQLAAGGAEKRLTHDGHQNVQPIFSPDGSTIAYVSQARGGIWLLPVRGGGPRRLTTFGSRPAFSPTGDVVVFQEDSRHEVAERSIPALPPSTLWVVDVDDGEPRRLTEPGEPSGGHGEPRWSPDGERVAFSTGDRLRSAVWTIGADGRDPRPVATRSRINLHPIYSPDGRYLYWVGIAEEQDLESSAWAVWRVRLARSGEPLGEPQRVTRVAVATIRHVALSPAGDELVYGALNTFSHLWSQPLADGKAAGEPRRLTRGRNRASRPAFSPDGRFLAFDRWQVGTNLDIWLLDRWNAAEPRRLTVAPEWDSQANWLPDGRRLVYLSEEGGGKRVLRVMEIGSGESELFADVGPQVDWARLSPDGTRIAYHSRESGETLNVWVYDVASGEKQQLTWDDELAAFPVWSPDGQWLAFEVRRGGGTEIAVMPSSGGEVRQLTFAEGENWPFSWAPDNDRIAFAALRDGFWNLWWVSRSTGEERQWTSFARLNAYVRYPAWSPVGDAIVYELSETVGDLWRVELENRGSR